jgi:hypothetical protein
MKVTFVKRILHNIMIRKRSNVCIYNCLHILSVQSPMNKWHLSDTYNVANIYKGLRAHSVHGLPTIYFTLFMMLYAINGFYFNM